VRILFLSNEYPPNSDGIGAYVACIAPALAAQGRLRAHVMEEGGFCLGLDTPEHYEAGLGLVASGAQVSRCRRE
jgi:hypothetical protein